MKASGRWRGSGGKVISVPTHARSGDGGEFLAGDAVAAHQHGLHALVAHLAHQQSALGMQAAEKHDIGVHRFDLGDDGGIILLAFVEALVEHVVHAGPRQRLAGFVGETFAIGRLVVDDGDFLVLAMPRSGRRRRRRPAGRRGRRCETASAGRAR